MTVNHITVSGLVHVPSSGRHNSCSPPEVPRLIIAYRAMIRPSENPLLCNHRSSKPFSRDHLALTCIVLGKVEAHGKCGTAGSDEF
jgi:hypothetical protein